MIRLQLDLMILKAFPNLSNSIILRSNGGKVGELLAASPKECIHIPMPKQRATVSQAQSRWQMLCTPTP